MSNTFLLTVVYHNGHTEEFEVIHEPTVLEGFLRFESANVFHAVPMGVVRRYSMQGLTRAPERDPLTKN